MRNTAIGFTFLACLGWGQSPDQLDRTFYLTHTATTQQFQEVATTIRTITDIREVSTDNDQKSVTVHATAPQDLFLIAEWSISMSWMNP